MALGLYPFGLVTEDGFREFIEAVEQGLARLSFLVEDAAPVEPLSDEEHSSQGMRSEVDRNREALKFGPILDEPFSGTDPVARHSAMLRAVSLPAHAATLRDLVTALGKLIPLECQACGIDATPEPNSYEEMLDKALALNDAESAGRLIPRS